MKMINVLQRLAELDAGNPNVASAKPVVNSDAAVAAIQKNLSEELSSESLKYLAGVKNAIAECGMMPQMPTAPATPASFSINATAANGDEVAGMLNQIMNLAGVKPVGPTDMPVDKPTTAFSTVPPMAGSGEDMKRMLDTMNRVDTAETDLVSGDSEPEDEGLGNEFGNDEMSMEEPAMDQDDSETGDVDISGVGGALAGAAIHGDADGAAQGMQDGEDDAMTGTNDEMRKLIDAVSMDNTPADPNDIPTHDTDKHAYNPNTGDHRERQAGLARANPMETVTSKLFADYEEFIAEASRSAEKNGRLTEGYYDLNDPGMQPIDLSAKPSFAEIVDRYSQLYYQSHEGEYDDEEAAESDAIEQYVAKRFGEKGSAHLQKAAETSRFGRDDKPYGRDSRSSNLGYPNQRGSDFRTTKAGKMHGQDAKVMKNKVSGRLGSHPEPNLPEQSVAERTMSRAAKGYEKYGKPGMTALSQAAKKGTSEKKMDAIRDKHDKYN